MSGALRWLSPRNLRIGLIAVPWLIAAVYLFVFAADRYVAESVVAVREEGGMSMPAGIDALSLMFGSSAGSREDQFMLLAHILSIDMLQQVDEALDLHAAYSSPPMDFVFRMSRDVRLEEFLDYYRRRVTVGVDDASGLITIRTQGFTPDIAQAVNREVVRRSEQFINESSHQLAREQMASSVPSGTILHVMKVGSP